MKKLLTIILVAITVQSFAPIKIFKDEEIIKKEIGLSHKEKIIKAICIKESGEINGIINHKESAYGCLQIRAIYLEEYYRLSHKKYTLTDMLDRDKAIEVFTTIMDNKCPGYSWDSVSAVHNGGGLTEYDFIITADYAEDIKRIYKTL